MSDQLREGLEVVLSAPKGVRFDGGDGAWRFVLEPVFGRRSRYVAGRLKSRANMGGCFGLS